MKKLITYLCPLFIAISGIAQVDSLHFSGKDFKHETAAESVHTSLSLATGMVFSKSSPTAVFTCIAPSMHYRITQKFKLNATLMHYSVNGSSFFNKGLNDYRASNTVIGNIVQLQGQYLVNKKTLVSGSVFYDINMLATANHAFKGASVGMDYKLTPHTTFSVRTTVIRGNDHYNPFSSFNPLGAAPGFQPVSVFNPYFSPFNF